MQSKATTVQAYLDSLPDDRRDALNAVRQVILKHADKNIREGMQYGMIGYFVPHEVFPAGYHCDPKQPLPYAGLASQKGHMSLYMMGLYIGEPASDDVAWFQKAWLAAGKKLDMGKSCIRFKKLDDLALDVLGEAIRRFPSNVYIKRYQEVLDSRPGAKPKAKAAPKPGAKSAGADTRKTKPASQSSRPARATSKAKTGEGAKSTKAHEGASKKTNGASAKRGR